MRTLGQILIDSNAYLDLDATLPTSTELTTRANYANRAVFDAASLGVFSEFHRIYEVDPTTLASISLPANFREFSIEPRQPNGSDWDKYPVIAPEERFNYQPNDRYCYVLGNPMSGYTAVFNNLTANVTLSMDFQRYPSGLATLSDICELPDAMYVVDAVEALVLESRSDDRFPIKKTEKNEKLQNMLGREMKRSGGENRTRRIGAAAYRIGE